MRWLIPTTITLLSCSRETPAPPVQLEAEVHAKETAPDAHCVLSGTFHVPRTAAQKINSGTSWTGTTSVVRGDLVVLTVDLVGSNTWACDLECAIREPGTQHLATAKSPALTNRPAPTCSYPSPTVTCVFH